MEGKTFLKLVADITYYSTLSGEKIKDADIIAHLKITKNRYAHYKRNATSRIPEQVSTALRQYHQSILDKYQVDNEPALPSAPLDQDLAHLRALLEAERSARVAQAKTIALLEEKLLRLVEQAHAVQLEAIEGVRQEIGEIKKIVEGRE